MQRAFRFIRLLLLAVVFLGWSTAFGQAEDMDDKTLAPYFFVPGGDEGVERLPLKSTQAQVNIAGVIADVKVTQVYQNTGSSPIEATYVFPASTRAAVYGMKMTIGKRVIEAKIRKRDVARQEYEQARSRGQSASLLEQQRPNVFQMNVANIMPGDVIKVEMGYTELIIPNEKVYEFVYPTVVGPRYSNRSAAGAGPKEAWVKNPYLHQGQAPTYSFDIAVNINAGLPISSIASPSHGVTVAYSGPDRAEVKLDAAERHGGNRDYILKYRLDGDKIQTGLLLSQGVKENHFLLMLQPPKRMRLSAIPAREYIFIVDVSGSMHGFPLEISKRLLKDLIGGLRPTDRFNVLLFSGGSAVLAEESLSASQANIGRACAFIDSQEGGGGTELLPAMRRALALKRAVNCSRTLVIATDGYVSVEEETFDLIRGNLGNANLFAFGIGTGVNRHLIEGMAHVGMGEPFIITRPEEAPGTAERFRGLIAAPMLTRVRLEVRGFEAYDIEPANIPDVLSERPVIVFGKWRGTPRGSMTVSGVTGEGRWRQRIAVDAVKPRLENAALKYLWARERIMLLADYNMLKSDDKRIREVTELGLKYNLLTAYTSFVAVDSLVRNVGGKQTSVTQPLPLPQGVSDYAVGGAKLCRAMSMAPMAAKEETADAIRPQMAAPEQKGKGGARMSISALRVSNTIAEAGVRNSMQALLPVLSGCLKAGGPSTLTIEVRLSIKADGTVGKVAIKAGARLSAAERDCMERLLKQQRFPLPIDGQGATARVVLKIQ